MEEKVVPCRCGDRKQTIEFKCPNFIPDKGFCHTVVEKVMDPDCQACRKKWEVVKCHACEKNLGSARGNA